MVANRTYKPALPDTGLRLSRSIAAEDDAIGLVDRLVDRRPDPEPRMLGKRSRERLNVVRRRPHAGLDRATPDQATSPWRPNLGKAALINADICSDKVSSAAQGGAANVMGVPRLCRVAAAV